MRQVKESPAGTQGQSSEQDKDTNNNRIRWQIRKLFREGGKYTAKQLNALTGGNDARKLYWLEPDNQPDLFEQTSEI